MWKNNVLHATLSVNTLFTIYRCIGCRKQNQRFYECFIHLSLHQSMLQALKFQSQSKTMPLLIFNNNLKGYSLVLGHKVACNNPRCFPFTQKHEKDIVLDFNIFQQHHNVTALAVINRHLSLMFISLITVLHPSASHWPAVIYSRMTSLLLMQSKVKTCGSTVAVPQHCLIHKAGLC